MHLNILSQVSTNEEATLTMSKSFFVKTCKTSVAVKWREMDNQQKSCTFLAHIHTKFEDLLNTSVATSIEVLSKGECYIKAITHLGQKLPEYLGHRYTHYTKRCIDFPCNFQNMAHFSLTATYVCH